MGSTLHWCVYCDQRLPTRNHSAWCDWGCAYRWLRQAQSWLLLRHEP